jgi:hypothetical protein
VRSLPACLPACLLACPSHVAWHLACCNHHCVIRLFTSLYLTSPSFLPPLPPPPPPMLRHDLPLPPSLPPSWDPFDVTSVWRTEHFRRRHYHVDPCHTTTTASGRTGASHRLQLQDRTAVAHRLPRADRPRRNCKPFSHETHPYPPSVPPLAETTMILPATTLLTNRAPTTQARTATTMRMVSTAPLRTAWRVSVSLSIWTRMALGSLSSRKSLTAGRRALAYDTNFRANHIHTPTHYTTPHHTFGDSAHPLICHLYTCVA